MSRLSIGYDNIGHDISLGSASNVIRDKLGSIAVQTQTFTNTASADIEGFETVYATLNITDWLYFKMGSTSVDVKTTETIESSSGVYPDASLSGGLIGIGVHKESDNGMFFRLELNEYSIDGTTITQTGSADKRSVVISDVSGSVARISIGKAF